MSLGDELYDGARNRKEKRDALVRKKGGILVLSGLPIMVGGGGIIVLRSTRAKKITSSLPFVFDVLFFFGSCLLYNILGALMTKSNASS